MALGWQRWRIFSSPCATPVSEKRRANRLNSGWSSIANRAASSPINRNIYRFRGVRASDGRTSSYTSTSPSPFARTMRSFDDNRPGNVPRDRAGTRTIVTDLRVLFDFNKTPDRFTLKPNGYARAAPRRFIAGSFKSSPSAPFVMRRVLVISSQAIGVDFRAYSNRVDSDWKRSVIRYSSGRVVFVFIPNMDTSIWTRRLCRFDARRLQTRPINALAVVYCRRTGIVVEVHSPSGGPAHVRCNEIRIRLKRK